MQNALHGKRTALSANVRDYAEGAAIITSILNLEIRTRPLIGRLEDRRCEQLSVSKNIADHYVGSVLSGEFGEWNETGG
jgi:hypothetical protein